MAQKTWTLTDVDNNQYVDQIDLGPDDVAGAAGGYSVHKRTLRGGLRDGVDVIKVDNGSFCFTVVPTRGMGLWRASLGEVHLGWQSPVRGPVHPGFVRIAEPSGLGWLDGFDELLVRCGLESNGAPEHDANGKLTYPLHGKIANLPAHKTEVTIDGDTGQISVSGEVDEMRLFFNKLRLKTTYTTKLGQAGVTVTDTVSNVSAEPNELQLLYHINFGVPLLNAGSKLVAPVATVAPPRRRRSRKHRHLGYLRSPNARLERAMLLFRSRRRLHGPHPRALAQRRRQPGREPSVQQEPTALLHSMEKPSGSRRRLRNRPGTGHQLPQRAQLRKRKRPRRRPPAGRVTRVRDYHRSPRLGRVGRSRQGRNRQAPSRHQTGHPPKTEPRLVCIIRGGGRRVFCKGLHDRAQVAIISIRSP